MTDPTANPAFSGIKLPVFDDLVTSHTRAAPALEQLAHDLWAELNKLGVDTSPALRIRTLAQRLHSHSTELQRRQRQVHELQQGGGTQHCTTSGIFWELKEVSLPTPSPQPGQPPPDLAELSYELMSANLLPRRGRLRADGTPFSRAEDAVLSWMEVYRETILQEAARWRISPKAIVAAIAWEAIDNPQPFRHPIPAGSGLGRIHPRLARWATGPGKIHTDFPLVKQIEARGYLPPRSLAERESILSTDEGSIKYIAAIMGAFADVAEQDGRHNIRNHVPMLTQLYQGWDLRKWEEELRHKPDGEKPGWGDDMAEWAEKNPEFLTAALEKQPGPTPTFPAPAPPAPTPGPSPAPR
ncbi:hypothetical protein OIE63_07555 [Streptomyces sp. NBC_01795]|uniref:hypothetical protein n=1 Tax=unclassified Streptomyces TaxID=2593676 RepID=UPI002DD98D24|nr:MULTISPECIES: hypothetical protein [unclassified Streptomyces]WSA91429.1 hypothetical protein OIE63_07555 [Streptomyces sp. NBC_01795]WSB75753.1 hypothetical protein OHB04_08080 [Streptomyces sp. NBC_01775]